MKQNRLYSPVVWGTIVSQLLAIMIALDIVDVAQSEVINNVVVAVLQLLVTFGILNNPVTPDRF